jgi:hypothetical protein
MAVAASGHRLVRSVKAPSPVVDECVKNIHHNSATGPSRLKTRTQIHHQPRRAPICPGNKYHKAALCIAALAASGTRGTYLAARFRRISARRGQMKALVAVKHSILTAAWNMLANGECYTDRDRITSGGLTLTDPEPGAPPAKAARIPGNQSGCLQPL